MVRRAAYQGPDGSVLRHTRAESARSVRAESARDDFAGCAVNERQSLSSVITTVVIIIVVAPCCLCMNGLGGDYAGSRVTARVGAGGTRALGDSEEAARGGGRGAMAGRL